MSGFSDGNRAEGLLNLASAAGDIGKMLTDPMAYFFSAGFGWMLSTSASSRNRSTG